MLDNKRKTKLKYILFSTILLQIVTAVSGIILPRLMIGTFGSEINGIVVSITQFLSYISLMEAGIGSVARVALYKPLAENDTHRLSVVLKSCSKFFKNLSYMFLIYIGVLVFVLPRLASFSGFSFEYVLYMILILSISIFSQYYFSITYQLLIQADQKAYIVNFLQIITIILNLILTVLLIKLDCNIHIVKFGSAIVFLLRPYFINLYVKKHYKLEKVKADKDTITQKWDGFAHHIAYFIHKNTDIVILSFFSNLKEISVYSIYNTVVVSIQAIINSVASSFSYVMGDMYARKETKLLKNFFVSYETLIYYISNIIFPVTLALIVPFIRIYIGDTADTNYERTVFAFFIVMAEYFYTLRAPYSNLIFSAGFFKQTKYGAFIEAGLNIIVSLCLVSEFGITGVALGTMFAMLYRTIDYIIFTNKNIINRNLLSLLIQPIISVLTIIIVVGFNNIVLKSLYIDNFGIWILCGFILSVIAVLSQTVLQILFNKQYFIGMFDLFKKNKGGN